MGPSSQPQNTRRAPTGPLPASPADPGNAPTLMTCRVVPRSLAGRGLKPAATLCFGEAPPEWFDQTTRSPQSSRIGRQLAGMQSTIAQSPSSPPRAAVERSRGSRTCRGSQPGQDDILATQPLHSVDRQARSGLDGASSRESRCPFSRAGLPQRGEAIL